MAYIIKNTTGLINTRVTDAGRRKMSQGNFNIRYFQVGDSEICYNCNPGYNQVNNYIFEPCFNSHNSTAAPENNKQYIKYPIYVDNASGNTYGIPFMDSTYDPVFNAAKPRGFFSGSSGSFQKQYLSGHTVNSNYRVLAANLTGTNTITLNGAVACDPNPGGQPTPGSFITIFFNNTSCTNTNSRNTMLTYKVISSSQAGTNYNVTLDRTLPNFSSLAGNGRVFVYPSGLTPYYDSYTPSPHWYDDVIDFESVCTTDAFDVEIWNMNIPWTETPAGINTGFFVGFSGFGSTQYIGSKEYLGYNSFSGHTIFDTGSTIQPNAYYYDSFDIKVNVDPKEQKAIAIVHYTNNTIDYFYGEKFALQPYDPTNPNNTMGMATNFKVSLPWLSWHKKTSNLADGQVFYVDPPNFPGLNLFTPYYIQSNMNDDMNDKGLRYYNLWDDNPNNDGYPSRVGKVFPDQKIVVFDDEEIIAAMSYKSNRNWTLPAPNISLVSPNVCSGSTISPSVGIMSSDTQYMYVTYRLDNSTYSLNSLHCNYYRKIQGPASACTIDPQNVAVRFGDEFAYMSTTAAQNLFRADSMKIICQWVSGDTRPDPVMWKEIDVTSQLSFIGGFIDPASIVSTTFTISEIDYNAAIYYDLSTYLPDLTPAGVTANTLNFGDEYYFYGIIETDIQATIYEMRYLCNLSQSEFLISSNPTWSPSDPIHVTEIALFDEDKDILVMSKLQSPVKRLGIQQLLVKFDF